MISTFFRTPDPFESVKTPNPVRERSELGPKQLEWCRRHLPNFRYAKKVADKVAAETERSRERHGEPV